MPFKLYVGNLSFDTIQGEIQKLFSMAGAVLEASIMHDKLGNNLRFAFVTMSSENEANEATRRFNGISFNGRSLLVSEARQDTRFRHSR